MSRDQVTINGSVMDRDFFEENLAEARLLSWAPSKKTESDHQHCIICNIALSSNGINTFFKSDKRYLCSHCHEHYLK